MISMLVDMETEDGLKRHAIMVVTKKLAWHMQTYSTIKLKIFSFSYVLLWFLIYNSEFSKINSSEFFSCKETLEEAFCTP